MYRTLDIACPAGDSIAETQRVPACRCRVEESTLTVKSDPRTLGLYCTTGYGECPTWRAEKERIWASQRARLIDDPLDEP